MLANRAHRVPSVGHAMGDAHSVSRLDMLPSSVGISPSSLWLERSLPRAISMTIIHRDAGYQHAQPFETPELAQLSRNVSGQPCVATKVAAANKKP